MALVNDIVRLQKYLVKLLLQLMNLADDFVHAVLLNILSNCLLPEKKPHLNII